MILEDEAYRLWAIKRLASDGGAGLGVNKPKSGVGLKPEVVKRRAKPTRMTVRSMIWFRTVNALGYCRTETGQVSQQTFALAQHQLWRGLPQFRMPARSPFRSSTVDLD